MARGRVGSEGTQPVKSAVRTIELLEFFGRTQTKRSLGEIHARLNYPKSSLYVLLQTLIQLGWVETDQTGLLYGLGARALLVGSAYLDGDEMVKLAGAAMDRLARETTETVHLARLDRTDVVYLASRESEHYLRPFSRVGRRLPAHSTALGKALLAERSDDELRELLPEQLEALTERTCTSRDALLEDLASTRRRGYATEREENTLGLSCFGVALRTRTPPTDALSCSIPVARLNPARAKSIAASLRAARDAIESAAKGLT
ncbi:MAG TPA: IclR family transcriptional regulator [Streptosporangiaceae bacterium]|nr:IclR family transcriptional regulator [Streptosporangiaceae bacterium]